MKDLKTLTLLSQLSETSLNQFRDYLLYRYDKSNQLVRIFDFVMQGYPDFKSRDYCTPQAIAVFLYIDKGRITNESTKQASNKLNMLLDDLKDFLAITALRKDDFLKKWLLMAELNEIGHNNLLIETADKLVARMEKKDTPPYNKFSTTLSAQRMLLQSLISTEVEPRKKNSDPLVFEQYANALLQFTSLAAVKLACEMGTLYAKDKNASDPSLLQPLLDMQPPGTEQPLLHIYQSIFKLLSNAVSVKERDEHFHLAFELLKRHAAQFAPSETERIVSLLTNYCTKKIHAYEPGYQEKFIQIMQVAIENQAYRVVCSLSPAIYTNYVSIACALGKPQEAKSFVNEYTPYLNDEFREDVTRLAQATVCLCEKDYANVSKILNLKSEFINTQYEIRRRMLLIQSAFEDNTDSRMAKYLTDGLSNFERLLNRRVENGKMIEADAQPIAKFIQIVSMMVQQKSKKAIKSELNKPGHVVAREWINTQVNKM